jgi:anti-sigma regulatory factor (Ser/Thr protein kinase)
MATMEVRRQDNEWVLQRTVLAAEASVGLLRGYAESALIKWDLGSQVDDVRLVVSELATNAVRARSGAARIIFRISLLTGQGPILVEMTDPFPGRPELRDAADSDESGRGLFIVRMLAENCGYRDEPDGGKTVWATLRTSE